MSVKDLKISAITKRIARLEQIKHAYEVNEDLVGVAMVQLAINIYKQDLEDLCLGA